MDSITPTGISADRKAKIMTIIWKDGHSSVLPFSLLRKVCPCAACQERGETADIVPDSGGLELPLIDTRMTMIRRVELVGNYALTIEWEDGHHFGIYQWDYLRSLGDQE